MSAIPDGFRLAARSDSAQGSHPLARRNGDQLAERLAECSLYRRDLDLAIYAPDGQVAAYGLFWADPVTGVGLVEPLRTHGRYQGEGLGRHVLTAGLNRLAARGCRRLKVSYISGNDAATRLYLGVGFRPNRRAASTGHGESPTSRPATAPARAGAVARSPHESPAGTAVPVPAG